MKNMMSVVALAAILASPAAFAQGYGGSNGTGSSSGSSGSMGSSNGTSSNMPADCTPTDTRAACQQAATPSDKSTTDPSTNGARGSSGSDRIPYQLPGSTGSMGGRSSGGSQPSGERE